MQVNMNSWHYRLIENLFDGDASHSLCVYFWQVALRLLFVGAVTAFMWTFFGMLAVALATSAGWIAAATTPFWLKACIFIFGAFVTLGLLLAGLAVCFLILYGVAKAILTVKELLEQWDDKQEEKEDNVLVAYIKAKKRKICPMLEFTHGDN